VRVGRVPGRHGRILQHQVGDPRGLPLRDQRRDVRAQRVPDQRHPRQPQRVGQPGHVVAEAVERIGGRARAAAVPAQVRGDRAVSLRDQCGGEAPRGRAARAAVQQDHRRRVGGAERAARQQLAPGFGQRERLRDRAGEGVQDAGHPRPVPDVERQASVARDDRGLRRVVADLSFAGERGECPFGPGDRIDHAQRHRRGPRVGARRRRWRGRDQVVRSLTMMRRTYASGSPAGTSRVRRAAAHAAGRGPVGCPSVLGPITRGTRATHDRVVESKGRPCERKRQSRHRR
jgi:hypothetical protein